MRDPSTFEARLADALEQYSEGVAAGRDPAAIVRVATQGSTMARVWWRGQLGGARLATISLIVLIALAIAAAVIVAGSQLVRKPALVVGPTSTPGSSQVVTRTSLLGMTPTVLADGRVLFTSASNRPTIWDPSTDVLTASGEHPTWPADIYGPSPAVLLRDGRVLTFGGSSEASLYDPASGQFEQTGSMHWLRQTCHCGVTFYAMAHPHAVVLHDGRVFVSGGTGAQPELYDPSTGTFTITNPGIPCDPSRAPVALLRDGRVLIACLEQGGTQIPRAAAAIYDPDAGTYITAGPRTTTNAGAATLLNDGRVLITGQGLRASIEPAEVYDPATDTFRRLSTTLNPSPFDAVLPLFDGRVLFLRPDQDPVTRTSTPGETVLFNPESETFVPVIPSIAGATPVQLPDGRVMVLERGSIRLFDPSQWP
jgi:hypothetical protein